LIQLTILPLYQELLSSSGILLEISN